MTDDERAFRLKIMESPGDMAPRLVYADWLDEHDRPAARARPPRRGRCHAGVYLA